MRNARRTLLLCLPASLLPGPAMAFRAEEASAEVAADYAASACPGTEWHVAQADGVSPAPERAPLARCPFCGCAVAGAPDHGEQPPPPE